MQSTRTFLYVFIVCFNVLPAIRVGPVTAVEPKDKQWSVIVSDFYKIHYREAFDKDAIKT